MDARVFSVLVPAVFAGAVLVVLFVPRFRPARLARNMDAWGKRPLYLREIEVVTSTLAVAGVIATLQWMTGSGAVEWSMVTLAMSGTLLAWGVLLGRTTRHR